jgi:hypothetical protein
MNWTAWDRLQVVLAGWVLVLLGVIVWLAQWWRQRRR